MGKGGAASLLGFALVACADDAPARPQVLLFIDTNTPVVDQLTKHPELSSDAAVDSLHVEVLSDNGDTVDARDITAADAIDWPVSFGIVPPKKGAVLHVRARAYNSAFVHGSEAATLAASANVVIDRLIDIVATDDGVDARLVVLSGDCFGARPTFATAASPSAVTCIDASHPAGAASDGVVATSASAAHASMGGSWALAVEQPCIGTAPPGAVCIKGGVTFLGDLSLAGFTDGIDQRRSDPLRPVALRPFFLDVHELTVARFRALVSAGAVTPPPDLPGANDCTWSTTTNDDLPINCVTADLAAAACAALHGVLPSEARWEHAARGRGKRYRYPWGNDDPQCCSASYARVSPDSSPAGTACGLPSGGPEPVASHTAAAGCSGPYDLTADGVADLGGSMQEWTSDVYAAFNAPCWGTRIATDPVCMTSDTDFVQRGGGWADPTWSLLSALRFTLPTNDMIGLRCAYDDETPP